MSYSLTGTAMFGVFIYAFVAMLSASISFSWYNVLLLIALCIIVDTIIYTTAIAQVLLHIKQRKLDFEIAKLEAKVRR